MKMTNSSTIQLMPWFKCGLFASWEVFPAFLLPDDFFGKSSFLKIPEIPSVSNSLNPDQAQHIVGPDQGPNCLQRLSADLNRNFIQLMHSIESRIKPPKQNLKISSKIRNWQV